MERIVRLIVESKTDSLREDQRAKVDNFLVITFTDKATREMKSRLVQRLQHLGLTEERRQIETAYISTIHGFCSRLLQENPFDAGLDPQFKTLDENQARRLRRTLFEEVIANAYKENGSVIPSLVTVAQSARLSDGMGGDALDALSQSTEMLLAKLRGAGRSLHEMEAALMGGQDAAVRLAEGPLRDLVSPVLLEIEALLETAMAIQDSLTGLAKLTMDALMAAANRNKETSSLLDSLDSLHEIHEITRKARVRGATAAEMELMALIQRMRVVSGELSGLFAASAQREEQAAQIVQQMWHLLIAFWRTYTHAKRQRGVVDTDDLTAEAVHLLENSSNVRARYCRRFRYILVDEFQDTDPQQMRLLKLLHIPPERASARGMPANTLFVVGDVQQSIYSFRNADPSLFQTLERRYRQQKVGFHVSLAVNFRSRPELLLLIEKVFQQIWRNASTPFVPLIPGAEFDPKSGTSLEILLTQDLRRSDYMRLETDALAARIQQMVTGEEIGITSARHPKRGAPIRYGDIAILLRSLYDVQKYEEAFAKRGVPCYVVGGGRGYYARQEIRDLINVLTILETPLDDVALMAALRSPMVGVDVDTLLRIAQKAQQAMHGSTAKKQTRASGQTPLYITVKEMLANAEFSPDCQDILTEFVTLIESTRAIEDRLPVGHLLERLLQRTQYDVRLLNRAGGRRRLANIRKLLQMANADPVMGVSEFIRRLKELEKLSDREGDAPTEEEASDVVRIQTIHSAKGLEFPVVILADLGRNLQHQEKALFLCDPHTFAIGTRLGGDPDLAYRAILQRRQSLEQEEYNRLLYVAMTRAQEHLILCGNLGRNQGITWADQLFALLGVLGMPAAPETVTLPGGITARVAPLAHCLQPIDFLPDRPVSTRSQRARLAEQIAEATVESASLPSL